MNFLVLIMFEIDCLVKFVQQFNLVEIYNLQLLGLGIGLKGYSGVNLIHGLTHRDTE